MNRKYRRLISYQLRFFTLPLIKGPNPRLFIMFSVQCRLRLPGLQSNLHEDVAPTYWQLRPMLTHDGTQCVTSRRRWFG